MTTKLLITGGAGFIGSHVAELAIKRGYSVHVFDNLSTGSRENLPSAVNFVHGDVCDQYSIEKAAREADGIIHLAAFTSVPLSVHRPERCYRVNVSGTVNVINAAAKSRSCARIVFASSSAVYFDRADPAREDMPVDIQSPYAHSKYIGEQMLAWSHTPAVSLRFFNVYGQRQADNDPYSGVLALWRKAYNEGSPCIVYGSGEQARDYVHVKDVAAAILTAMHELEPDVYNVGTGRATTLNEILAALPRAQVRHESARDADALFSVADISKISPHWRPMYGIADGLRDYFFGPAEKPWLETV